jgi:hypothetical protein
MKSSARLTGITNRHAGRKIGDLFLSPYSIY